MSENKPLKPCRSCPPETKQNCWQRCLKYYQWIKWRKEGTPITQLDSSNEMEVKKE